MQHRVENGAFENWSVDLLALPVPSEGWEKDEQFVRVDEALGGRLEALLKEEGFKGKRGSSRAVDTLGSAQAKRVFVYGMGDLANCDGRALRDYAHAAVQAANAHKGVQAGILAPQGANSETMEHLLVGADLGSYKFDHYLSDAKPRTVEACLWAESTMNGTDQAWAEAVARGVCRTRDLVNEPAGFCTPEHLAAQAQELSDKYGYTLEIFDRADLDQKGFGCIAAVSAGSDRQAYLIHLVYKPAGTPKKRIALVGKGITFDAGGYDLKPVAGILDMKMDMAGAATVLGVFDALGTTQPDVEVHGFIPTCENLVNGRAYKPGDVITCYNGKTIEIGNTDAEGRLILADALSYALETEPDSIIDMATLTGACVVALGGYTCGLFSNSDDLGNELLSAAAKSGESFWRMPLDKKIRKQLDSKIADIKNVGQRWGGAITAALFLEEFVNKKDWVHLDIAGPAFVDADLGHIPKGGTGFAVSTLVQMLKDS